MKDRCGVILSIHPTIQPAIWYYWMVITPLSKNEEYKDTLAMVPTLEDNIIQWKNHISKLYAIKNKLLLKYRGRHLTQVQGIGPSRLSGGRGVWVESYGTSWGYLGSRSEVREQSRMQTGGSVEQSSTAEGLPHVKLREWVFPCA